MTSIIQSHLRWFTSQWSHLQLNNDLDLNFQPHLQPRDLIYSLASLQSRFQADVNITSIDLHFKWSHLTLKLWISLESQHISSQPNLLHSDLILDFFSSHLNINLLLSKFLLAHISRCHDAGLCVSSGTCSLALASLAGGLFALSFIGGVSTATTPPTKNSKACKTQKTLVLDLLLHALFN